MRIIGIVLAVVGVGVLVYEIIMAITTYKLTHTHDSHMFMIGLAVGLVLAIIGGVMSRQQ